jgi:hypothetical protein
VPTLALLLLLLLLPQLLQAVAGALKKARSKILAFNKQLADSQRAGEVQKRGDLIIANVYRWGGAGPPL